MLYSGGHSREVVFEEQAVVLRSFARKYQGTHRGPPA